MVIYESVMHCINSWWRHRMETFSALLAICAGNLPASGEFPAQRPLTRSFDVFFYLCLNKRLRKQPWGWWFETLSRPLWRHCNVVMEYTDYGYGPRQRRHINVMASPTIVDKTVCSAACWTINKDHWPVLTGIHWWPVYSPHNGPVIRDAIIFTSLYFVRHLVFN